MARTKAMNTEHRRGVWSEALAIGGILLIAAAGLCWLHTVDDDHGIAGVDVCLGMMGPALGAAMVFYMNEFGRSPLLRRWTATPATIAVLDPPPWSSLSA